ncbi:hypothetical protein BUALT_Bualt10G0095900 [Buddleja alternifolia]|uniref:VQ domain-containing protein n=1 Tax=Buddleja alternifolia TaxID=168488 RepID=A0AAV6X4L4_9LAMI|nr:hypothetical protein BUALT_Bualt10G0095900 [Buddleja alternifolia]
MVPNSQTFIQADAATFREVVQKLTGAPQRLRPMSTAITKRSPSFKLQERRKHAVRDLEIIKLAAVNSSPVESPATPMGGDSVRAGTESPVPLSDEEEMIRDISEKGFYLHASPPWKAEERPPVLLTFPLARLGSFDDRPLVAWPQSH